MICVLLFLTGLLANEWNYATGTVRPSKTFDELAANQDLRQALLKGYDKHVHPNFGLKPVELSIGMSVIHISELDERTDTLTANLWLKLVWSDPRMKWDQKDHQQTVLRLPAALVWKPDIGLLNGVGTGEIDFFKETQVLAYPDGKMLWVPPGNVRAICSADIRNYPYDSHACSLEFGSWSHDAKRISLKPYSDTGAPDMSDAWLNSMWDFSDISGAVQRKQSTCCDEPFDTIKFNIRLTRRSTYYSVVLSIPCFVVVVLTLAVFWLPPHAGERITLGCFVLAILMLLILYLALRLPPSSKSVPRIASFCSISIIEISIVLVLSVVAISKTRRDQSGPPPPLVNMLMNNVAGKVLLLDSLKPLVSTDNMLDSTTDNQVYGADYQGDGSDDRRAFRRQWLAFVLAMDRILFVVFLLILLIQYMACFI